MTASPSSKPVFAFSPSTAPPPFNFGASPPRPFAFGAFGSAGSPAEFGSVVSGAQSPAPAPFKLSGATTSTTTPPAAAPPAAPSSAPSSASSSAPSSASSSAAYKAELAKFYAPSQPLAPSDAASAFQAELVKEVPALDQCAACRTRFAAGTSVLLPTCLHAVCRACAERSLDQNGLLVCPFCTIANVDVTRATLRPHPVVEFYTAHKTTKTAEPERCGQCESDIDDADARPAVRCAECALDLCEDHAALHRKGKTTRAHALSGCGHGWLPPVCLAHASPIKAFCRTCDQGVCLACTEAPHPLPDHAVELADDSVLAAGLHAIRQQTDACGERAELYASRLGLAHAFLEAWPQNAARIKEQIDAFFADIAAQVEARRAELQAEAAAQFAARVQQLTEFEVDERRRYLVAASTRAVLEELLSTAAPTVTVLELAPSVERRLRELTSGDPAPQPPTAPTVFSGVAPTVARLGLLSISNTGVASAGAGVFGLSPSADHAFNSAKRPQARRK